MTDSSCLPTGAGRGGGLTLNVRLHPQQGLHDLLHLRIQQAVVGQLQRDKAGVALYDLHHRLDLAVACTTAPRLLVSSGSRRYS